MFYFRPVVVSQKMEGEDTVGPLNLIIKGASRPPALPKR